MNPLKNCWHPVAYSTQVTNKPYGTKLLDEHLVIWRSSDNIAHAMKDLCIHRGTALSLGWVAEDSIVCPYHGWRYNQKGNCTLIPQTTIQVIPPKACVKSYQCQERYGLIWVALEEPKYPLAEIPEYESGDWKIVNTGPFTWKSDASRQV